MDDRGSVEALNDSALEREIEAALAVDPSPEFVPGVRSRIVAESQRSHGWRLRSAWVGGAVAATIAVLALRSGPSQGPSMPDPIAPDPALAVTTVTPGAQRLPPPQAPALSSKSVSVVRSGDTAPRAALPDVQRSEIELAGFHLLVAGAREGWINASLFGEAPSTPAEVQPFSEIEIPPIAIEPLEPVQPLQGDQS